MFQNAEEARKFIADEDVKCVDVRFCDPPGIMQHFTVPVEIFDPDTRTPGHPDEEPA